MRVKYFKDTDTALLEFSDRPIQETQTVNENIYLDLDADGNLVSITIEHATHTTPLPRLSFNSSTTRSLHRFHISYFRHKKRRRVFSSPPQSRLLNERYDRCSDEIYGDS